MECGSLLLMCTAGSSVLASSRACPLVAGSDDPFPSTATPTLDGGMLPISASDPAPPRSGKCSASPLPDRLAFAPFVPPPSMAPSETTPESASFTCAEAPVPSEGAEPSALTENSGCPDPLVPPPATTVPCAVPTSAPFACAETPLPSDGVEPSVPIVISGAPCPLVPPPEFVPAPEAVTSPEPLVPSAGTPDPS